MSCYGWERGTLVLPTAAVAPLKKTLREASNALFTEVLAEAKMLHKCAKTTSPKKYYDNIKANAPRIPNVYGRWSSAPDARKQMIRSIALSFLEGRAYGGGHAYYNATPVVTRLGVPTVAELEKFGIKKYTNRDDYFPCIDSDGFSEAGISFKGREVTWDVEENNRSVERARGTFLAGVFFDALSKIKWTRGTGGVLVGNDEYNRDSEYAGGGANYITAAYGPVGKQTRHAPSWW